MSTKSPSIFIMFVHHDVSQRALSHPYVGDVPIVQTLIKDNIEFSLIDNHNFDFVFNFQLF